jgi:signal transduction histidine kinase
MPESRAEVIFLMSIISLFILIMVIFIIIILFFTKKKQKGFTSDLNAVKENYEKELNKAQLEIQVQTFSEISREIHDNVGQFLAMAKLGISNLNFHVEKNPLKARPRSPAYWTNPGRVLGTCGAQ